MIENTSDTTTLAALGSLRTAIGELYHSFSVRHCSVHGVADVDELHDDADFRAVSGVYAMLNASLDYVLDEIDKGENRELPWLAWEIVVSVGVGARDLVRLVDEFYPDLLPV